MTDRTMPTEIDSAEAAAKAALERRHECVYNEAKAQDECKRAGQALAAARRKRICAVRDAEAAERNLRAARKRAEKAL